MESMAIQVNLGSNRKQRTANDGGEGKGREGKGREGRSEGKEVKTLSHTAEERVNRRPLEEGLWGRRFPT